MQSRSCHEQSFFEPFFWTQENLRKGRIYSVYKTITWEIIANCHVCFGITLIMAPQLSSAQVQLSSSEHKCISIVGERDMAHAACCLMSAWGTTFKSDFGIWKCYSASFSVASVMFRIPPWASWFVWPVNHDPWRYGPSSITSHRTAVPPYMLYRMNVQPCWTNVTGTSGMLPLLWAAPAMSCTRLACSTRRFHAYKDRCFR